MMVWDKEISVQRPFSSNISRKNIKRKGLVGKEFRYK